MGLEKTHGRNYDLARLLDGIHDGKIVLPEFQRDFLWDTTAVKQLLATCLTGWPMGSLLLLPGRSRIFFQVRPIEGVITLNPPYQMIVLDGQQRLTSLYQALFGTGPFRYAIRLDLVKNRRTIEDLEEAITSFPTVRWSRLYPDPRSQYQAGLLPITALRSASEFYAWRDKAMEGDSDPGRNELTRLYVDFLSGLDRYEVPAVVIDDEVHPEAVARIFERVNRLGQALSTFDLMVAKSFSSDFNLRDRWDLAQARMPRLAAFLQGDGLPVLNVIALQLKESVRQKDILDLSGAEVRQDWERSVRAVDEAVQFLHSHLGVWHPDWLPYRVQLSVLAALAMTSKLDYLNREVCEGWFWKSTFTGRYDVASNTRAVEDYKSLLQGVNPIKGEIGLDREVLLSVNRRQFGALHRGILCLLATSDPLDPFDESKLSRLSSDETSLPDITPVSFLARGSEPLNGHLLTLGMLLTAGHNARTHGAVNLDELAPDVLQSQLLPSPPPRTSTRRLKTRLDALRSLLEYRARSRVKFSDSDEFSE